MSERLFVHLDGDEAGGPETTAPAASLRAFTPRPALRSHVGDILVYRESFARGGDVIERVVPDGAVRLVFNLGDAPVVAGVRSAAAEALGAASRAALVELGGEVHGIAVTLRAGSVAAVLGAPAGAIAGTAVSLDTLCGRSSDELLAQLRECGDDASRVAYVQDFVERRLARHGDTPVSGMQAALRCVTLSASQRVGDMAAALGIGERRLQQLFHAEVGLTPRQLRRLVRLHDCLRRLRNDPAPVWAQLALDCGFYDQAHLINEFRDLCGVTPGDYLGRTRRV
jgi:AraC-like DNA-binding protein